MVSVWSSARGFTPADGLCVSDLGAAVSRTSPRVQIAVPTDLWTKFIFLFPSSSFPLPVSVQTGKRFLVVGSAISTTDNNNNRLSSPYYVSHRVNRAGSTHSRAPAVGRGAAEIQGWGPQEPQTEVGGKWTSHVCEPIRGAQGNFGAINTCPVSV